MRWLDFIFSFLFIFFLISSNKLRADAARYRRHHHSQNQRRLSSRIHETTTNHSDTSSLFSLSPEFMVLRRVYDDCQDRNDFVGCLKQKALIAVSRALERDTIKITDGLVLEKQNHTEKESVLQAFTDGRSLGSLSTLDRTLLSKLDKLLRTHTLKIDIGTGREGGGGGDDKDHKHHDKKGGHMKYVIAALVTAMGIAGPLGLKALAAIAIKALVISKVALTIAGIIALKKLFAHEGHEESSFQVHAGDHNRRSTYVVRPVPKASAVPVASQASVSSSSVDPYRYYYEYH